MLLIEKIEKFKELFCTNHSGLFYKIRFATSCDLTSGHETSNDVISGDATSGYILKTNNPGFFGGTSIL
jgi:hypothetical protein